MKRQILIPGLYLTFALLVWGGFVSGYHKVGAQALANLGLVVAVFPVAIIDIIVNAVFVHGDVILNWSNLFHKVGLPQGYLLDNGYYYFPRTLAMTGMLHLWQRRRKASRKNQSSAYATKPPANAG
jgi:hypothetical protein